MEHEILINKANLIKCLIMDVDGVLTDGSIYFYENGQTLRKFHVHDGMGIKALMNKDIVCAIITAHKTGAVEHRTAQLGITELYQGVEDKAAVLSEIIKKHSLTGYQVAYIGDDLNDLPALKQVGFPIAVNNAVEEVKKVALYVTKKDGGQGAVREVCDLILNSGNIKQKAVGVIPARYDSTRFPGKPLALINGYPMVYHVYKRAMEAQLDDVVIATDDQRILKKCQELDCKVLLTSKQHRTGTDRTAKVAGEIGADILVNIQGDEPLIEPSLINEVVKALKDDPIPAIATAKSKIKLDEEIDNPNVVKVVTDKNGYAIYFSRATVPYIAHDGEKNDRYQFYKHIGIYAYRRTELINLSKLPASPLEKAESLEQLRALENGVCIKVIDTEYESVGVDTARDLEKVKALFN